MDRPNLRDMTLEELEAFIAGMGKETYRARQIMKWLYRFGITDMAAMTTLAGEFRAELARRARIDLPEMVETQTSRDGTKKVLFRLVDVGAELFAMAAACARAEMLRRQGQPGAVEVADIFCRYARGRVNHAFSRVFRNNDVRTYRLAQHVLEGRHAWLEDVG